jgi:muramoyltetrapeptide carboxypeptidase LdcA involved in peptidoglycan recycling
LTTVGYGDITPVESMGRAVANLAMIAGSLLCAMPMAVITSTFQEIWARNRKEKEENEKLEARKERLRSLRMSVEGRNVASKLNTVNQVYGSYQRELDDLIILLRSSKGQSATIDASYVQAFRDSMHMQYKAILSRLLDLEGSETGLSAE